MHHAVSNNCGFAQPCERLEAVVTIFDILTGRTFSMSQINGSIQKIESIAEIERFICADTLVLFDLDHTVIESAELYGHGNWFYDQVRSGEDEGIPMVNTITRIFPEWLESQKHNKVRPVEEITPILIERLQSRGISVMALTARPRELIDSTLRQLKSIGVDFTRTDLKRPECAIDLDAPVTYHEGILFTADGQSKATALRHYFDEIGYQAKRVALVDDSMTPLQELLAMLQVHEIEFVGLHYPLIENQRHTWDAVGAEKEFARRGKSVL